MKERPTSWSVVPANVANVTSAGDGWRLPFCCLYCTYWESLMAGQARSFPHLERRSNPGGTGDWLRLLENGPYDVCFRLISTYSRSCIAVQNIQRIIRTVSFLSLSNSPTREQNRLTLWLEAECYQDKGMYDGFSISIVMRVLPPVAIADQLLFSQVGL
ncbi:hypothetical protein BDW71DRAFT_86240 [Aspergillus fruticulosus]